MLKNQTKVDDDEKIYFEKLKSLKSASIIYIDYMCCLLVFGICSFNLNFY